MMECMAVCQSGMEGEENGEDMGRGGGGEGGRGEGGRGGDGGGRQERACPHNVTEEVMKLKVSIFHLFARSPCK